MEENNIFRKNLNKLEKFNKLLYKELIEYNMDSYEIENVVSETALDGTKILKLIQNQHEWYLNSKYEVDQVAKEWVNKLGKIESIATIVMFGLGNGLYLKEMMAKASDSVLFLIYEPSIDIFLKAMSEINFSFLDKRVCIIVEGINDAYLEYGFQSVITYENLSVCKFVSHSNYLSCFQEKGKRYIERLQAAMRNLEVNKNTSIHLGEGYYKNILMNLKYLGNTSLLDQIENEVGKDIPEGYPAIIVSAGPSLSKNIKELKKAKGKAFILAVDTALVGLLDEGIIPDAFTTIEPTKELNRFEDSKVDLIPMICPETANYQVLLKHKDKKIFMNNTHGYGNIFHEKLGITYKGSNSGGSVATFAYTVARAMGFRTIILVGQDLAFTGGTRYYDKVKAWSDHETLPASMYVEVEDIYGGKVKTSKDLKLYIDWFENVIKDYSEIEMIDATEGGAKIHGSRILSLSDAIKEKCQVKFDMVQYLRELPEPLNNEEKQKMMKLIKKIWTQAKKLYIDSTTGSDLYSELIKKLEENANLNEIVELSKLIGKTGKKVENNFVYFHIEHKIREKEYAALKNLGISLDDAAADALQIAQRGKIIYEAIKLVLENGVMQEIKQAIGQIKFEE